MSDEIEWWEEEAGFFGEFYMRGDNSVEGYLAGKDQSLQQRTDVEVCGVEKLLGLHPGDKILDCPCGYGRHSIELAKKGYGVIASDNNSVHMNALGQHVLQEREHGYNLSASLMLNTSDMRNLHYGPDFDAVINMFFSFGFFKTDEKNKLVLKNFFDALKPGGKFLMHTDVNLPRVLSGKYKADETRGLVSAEKLKIFDIYIPATKRIEGSWNIDGEIKPYSVRVYSEEEFVALCLSVGFSSCETYSDWDGSPYSENAEDMLVVATK